MAELISVTDCARLLTRYNETDKSSDFHLIRYYLTENELIVKILYRDVDLKCVIDKLSFVDNEVPNAKTIQDFITYYLKAPMPVIQILGEEAEEEVKVKLQVSQVP